ncbi:Malic acid transport protein [Teratosphaeria destructans]|uniref:Malic acid transport protein n=1 Tax=Teratosphaeria destructans TaxID=418781 RepID=A0A9W7W780_9PEZI|nr:Malic acid transport protein [Teratosphaeria destructans]
MPQFRERAPHPEKPEEPPNGIDDDYPDRVGLRDRICHFTWPWFACTMSTGAVAVVISTTPNQFPGLQTIGKIFFIVDLVLFLLFTGIITTRFILKPAKLGASLQHPVEGLFFGAYWVSIALIINCIELYGVPSTGPWLVKTLQVVYWIYVGIVLVVAIFQYFFYFQNQRLPVEGAMPAWIFPVYPLLVIGPLAGTLIKSQPTQSAYTMWVGAVMLQGLAWTVSLLMYGTYMQRLMASELPPPPSRPGMYVSVGPAGYTAAGLISLGTNAPSVIAGNMFQVTTTAAGEVIDIVGVLAGSFVLLFSFWFFCISTVSVISGMRKMTFTLNWWAMIFPNGGLCLGAIQFANAKAFNSRPVDGIVSALTILLVIMWLVVAAANIKAVIEGRILWPGKDEDKDMKGIRWGRQVA